MRPMSLSQYRSTIKIKGEKSALFAHKNEIFESIEMGLSHAQIHYFLTSQKGLKISRQALTAWLKKHKNTKEKVSLLEPIQKTVQTKENTTVTQKNEVANQPKVEPTATKKVDDRASKVREKMGAATEGLPDGLLEMFYHTILKN